MAHAEARCPGGFEEGPPGTCFALPEHPAADTATVLYVHSASNEATIAQELEAVKAAFGSTMVILFVRGSESECALSTDVHAARCWPQPGDDRGSQRLWEHWDKVQWQAEALLPEGRHPRLILGFEEGAAFAARAWRRGAVHATMAGVVAPAELDVGEYPEWLVGIGVPAAVEPLFANPATAVCTRPRGAPLGASDLDLLAALFELATHPVPKGAAPKSSPSACIIHPARTARPKGP